MWPLHLKVANLCIIPKPKKDCYDVPKAFRPIALLNTIGKLMTKVLAKRLQFDGIAHGLFHPGQFGGVTKHATMDVGVILMDIISQNRDRGFHTSVLAVNITQFFPSMDHEVIVYLLGKLGFHRKICSVVANFLRDCQTLYMWDGISSEAHFDCSNGVPQGDPLSPVLLVLYLSLIIKHVLPWDKDNHTNALFFIDDGMLICSSASLNDNVALLALLYTKLLHFLESAGLTVEHTKSELKHFIAYDRQTNRRVFASVNQPDLLFSWKGASHTIKPAKIWRYLGFFFDSYLKFDHHVRYYTNKGFSTIRAFNMLGNSARGLGPKQRVLAYNACVTSVLTYSLPLWYAEDGKGVQSNFKHMCRVQSFVVRWITGSFRGMPIGAMELITGIPPYIYDATSSSRDTPRTS